MRGFRLLFFLFGTLLSATALTADEATAAPLPYDGDNATYIVYRGDTPVGYHTVQFSGGDTLAVTIATRATMRIFGIWDIPFIYDSSALWRDNTLLTLSASFYRGGEMQNYQLQKDGERYRNGEQHTVSAPLFPTNHWNAAVLQQTVLFNTLNGKFIKVNITPVSEESLRIGTEDITTTRYDVSGDLDISLWYDSSGKWLQLRFSVLGSDYTFRYTPLPAPAAVPDDLTTNAGSRTNG